MAEPQYTASGRWKKGQTIEVEVTQDDLDNGNMESPYTCPIALAMMRQGFPEIIVGSERTAWTIYDGTQTRRYQRRNDAQVAGIIGTIDSGKKDKLTPFAIRVSGTSICFDRWIP